MIWLYTEFKPYAIRHGVNLQKTDFLLIERVLAKLPSDVHRRIMRDYVKTWMSAIGQSKTGRPAKDLGRKTANTWLRQMVGDRDEQ